MNRTIEAIPTPLAIIGIPGQFTQRVKIGKISAYEVLGREVVLYWRTLPAQVDTWLFVLATVPGKYTGPASQGYLYNTDEHKQWVDGLAVEIEPKE